MAYYYSRRAGLIKMEDLAMYSRQTPPDLANGAREGATGSPRLSRVRRFLPVVLLSLVFALCALGGTSHMAAATTAGAPAPVDVTSLTSEINAATQNALASAINTAEHDGAQALVIQ